MNQKEIMKILPHRDAMLLLDEAESRDGEAVGRYHVRGDEFFLQGHFPGNPVVPGVILCEILAQSACVLMRDAMTEGKLPVYTGLNHDTVEARCHIKRAKHPFYFAEGTITVEERLCVSAEFSFAVTGAAS